MRIDCFAPGQPGQPALTCGLILRGQGVWEDCNVAIETWIKEGAPYPNGNPGESQARHLEAGK
eukprot:8633758-Lingulodinium_polyedra.AAC.1